MGTNERSDRIVVVAQIVVLAVLVWVGWQVKALRDGKAAGPKLSGVALEWTVKLPNREPVRIVHQLEVGETTEQWQRKLRELIDGVESFDD